MKSDHYPTGYVKDLLNTGLVKANTVQVLRERLDRRKTTNPVFFSEHVFRILEAVCRRLIPQPGRQDTIDLAGLLDTWLASGKGKGWRYDELPAGNFFFQTGLHGINDFAEAKYDKPFTRLEGAIQDMILSEAQSGNIKGKVWEQLNAKLFFEELLAALTILYYSHPIAKEEIGDISFADGKGWQQIGLNKPETYEPLRIKNNEK